MLDLLLYKRCCSSDVLGPVAMPTSSSIMSHVSLDWRNAPQPRAMAAARDVQEHQGLPLRLHDVLDLRVPLLDGAIAAGLTAAGSLVGPPTDLPRWTPQGSKRHR